MSEWGEWIGRQERVRDVIAATPAERLAATLDLAVSPLAEGAALPPLWHWLYCLSATPRSDLGEDGHARRGLFLPPIPLRRRMYAGGRISFPRPLLPGDEVERTSTVAAITEKEGRTGPLIIVTVRHEFTGPRGVAVEEEQDLVYTNAPPADRPEPAEEPPDAPWMETVATDPVLLFRFSALTYNSHRIHYDADWVTNVEGYPGLVVHGPLAALLLANLAGAHGSVTRFSFRARAPFFVGDDLLLRGTPDGTGAALAAYTTEGILGMEARAERE